MECPAAARAVNEMAEGVVLIGPQPRDPACLAMFAPESRVDPVVGVERRDDDIGDGGIALGMAGFTGEFNADLPKLCRQRRIQDGFGMGALHFDYQSLLGGSVAQVVAKVIFALLPPISQVLRRPPASSGF